MLLQCSSALLPGETFFCDLVDSVCRLLYCRCRYKTTLCNLGDKCSREICFFAHSHKELRAPEPVPLANADTPAGQAAAAAAGIEISAGSFTGLSDSMPQTGCVPVLYNGQVVELASSSYHNPVAEPMVVPHGLVAGGLPSIHEQQQLQLLNQQHAAQQAQRLAGSRGAGSSTAAGGMVGHVVQLGSGHPNQPLDQQQQQQQLLQDFAQFDSFTSQASLQQPGQSMQQQLLRQDLGNFESFTSQGSLQLQQQSFTSQSSSMPQPQLGQHSFTSTRQGEIANLHGDLTNFDSFSTQSSRGGVAALQQLQQQQNAGQGFLRQDLSNFESFTSQGSRTGGIPSLATLQQLQQQLQQSVAGPLSLRQDLTNFESFTSQGSRGGLTGLQQLQAGDQAALMRQDFDSFTSQCSTSSQVLGAGYKSLPVSPLLDRAQGLQVHQSGASFSGVQGSAGSFTVQRSGGSLSSVPGVQSSGSSFTAQVSNRGLRPVQGGAAVPPQGPVYQGLGAGASARAASSSGAGVQGLTGVSAVPGALYQIAAPQQQQQVQDAELQQQVMQLQLQAQELWRLE